jgi:hypothetical protein
MAGNSGAKRLSAARDSAVSCARGEGDQFLISDFQTLIPQFGP